MSNDQRTLLCGRSARRSARRAKRASARIMPARRAFSPDEERARLFIDLGKRAITPEQSKRRWRRSFREKELSPRTAC